MVTCWVLAEATDSACRFFVICAAGAKPTTDDYDLYVSKRFSATDIYPGMDRVAAMLFVS